MVPETKWKIKMPSLLWKLSFSFSNVVVSSNRPQQQERSEGSQQVLLHRGHDRPLRLVPHQRLCGGRVRSGLLQQDQHGSGACAVNLTLLEIVSRHIVSRHVLRFLCFVADTIPLLQHSVCNGSSIPYDNLFPMDNHTLEVDIYKGVSNQNNQNVQ